MTSVFQDWESITTLKVCITHLTYWLILFVWHLCFSHVLLDLHGYSSTLRLPTTCTLCCIVSWWLLFLHPTAHFRYVTEDRDYALTRMPVITDLRDVEASFMKNILANILTVSAMIAILPLILCVKSSRFCGSQEHAYGVNEETGEL